MAKTPVNLRLDAGLLRRIDEYAERRLSNRTAVVQAACLAFLEDARAGVPDLPATTVPKNPVDDQPMRDSPSRQPVPRRVDDRDWQEIEMERRRARR